jgi:hypothetical protein
MKKVNTFLGKFFLPLIFSLLVGLIAYEITSILVKK